MVKISHRDVDIFEEKNCNRSIAFFRRKKSKQEKIRGNLAYVVGHVCEGQKRSVSQQSKSEKLKMPANPALSRTLLTQCPRVPASPVSKEPPTKS